MSRHIADAAADGGIVPYHIPASDRGSARIREGKGGENPEQGGLPRPVRTYEAEDFALAYLQAHIVQGKRLSVGLAYSEYLYCTVSHIFRFI